MGFADDVRDALLERIGEDRPYRNRKQMADALGMDPSQLNRFLKKERGLTVEALGRIMDALGGRPVFADRPDGQRCQVRLADGRKTDGASAGDYLAIPLETDEGEWVFVGKGHFSAPFHADLAAMRLAPEDDSMTPTLHPGDIVVVDRNDCEPSPPGALMLVRGSDGPAVRRVVEHLGEDGPRIVFYCDNNRCHPPVIHVAEHESGDDHRHAILGRVLRAWTDMTRN